ncbi:hypothetical protein THAOC_28864 [Thalassiosira oceanica]|uniref:Uncharacterized protein n=1 Tax=Thalassiosira oceanica TaxID=159749 RepID=K0RF93_THAOC|nr:hypothetical protein THAOC_28864 [Thalassiosira oceanica]|eukprot:EJK51920.1 hypothetical protein THAOC_28864 [Thalassiosira oceanica]
MAAKYPPTSPMDGSMLGGNTPTMNCLVKRPMRNFFNGKRESPSTPETNVSSVDNVRFNKEVDNQEDPKHKLAGTPSTGPKRNGISKYAATSYWTPEPKLARNSPVLKSPPAPPIAPPIPSSNLEPMIGINTVASESKHDADGPSDGSFSNAFVYQVQPAECQGDNVEQQGLGSRRRRSLRPPRLHLMEPSYSGGICLPEAKRRQTWDPSMLKLTLNDCDNLDKHELKLFPAQELSPSKFCLLSVKQLGKKSGNTLWIAPNTNTWPIGDKGINKMIITGTNVIVSLNVRLESRK